MAFRFETANERWKAYKQSIMENPQLMPGGYEYADKRTSPGLGDDPEYYVQEADRRRTQESPGIYVNPPAERVYGPEQVDSLGKEYGWLYSQEPWMNNPQLDWQSAEAASFNDWGIQVIDPNELLGENEPRDPEAQKRIWDQYANGIASNPPNGWTFQQWQQYLYDRGLASADGRTKPSEEIAKHYQN